MLDGDVNMLAVLVAAVSAMVIGSLWYGPLFNKQWTALAGHTPGSMGNNSPTVGYIVAAVASLATAFVLANVLGLTEANTAVDGALDAVILGTGFQATVLATNYVFNSRQLGLYWLDAANLLVTIAVMGAILGAWQ